MSVDVSEVTRFDLWVFQCLEGCVLLLLLRYIGWRLEMLTTLHQL